MEFDEEEAKRRLERAGLGAPEIEHTLLRLRELGSKPETACFPIELIDQAREALITAVTAPPDLTSALDELEAELSDDELDWFRQQPEEDLVDLHFAFGACIRTRWASPESRLALWFQQRGVHHPDDLSTIVMTSLHRRLNGKPLKVEDQLESFRAYWGSLKGGLALKVPSPSEQAVGRISALGGFLKRVGLKSR